MTKKAFNGALLRGLLLSATLALGFSCQQHVFAYTYSGDRFEDDFDFDLFPGWFPSATSSSPDGGRFLGPLSGGGEAMLGLLDFVDDLEGSERLIDISFSSTDASGNPSFQALTVDLNGTVRQSTLRTDGLPLAPRFGIAVPSNQIDFSVDEFGGGGDLLIRFTNPQRLSFGLDNVVVDWSQPVPEPRGWLPWAVGTCLLPLRRKGNESPNDGGQNHKANGLL